MCTQRIPALALVASLAVAENWPLVDFLVMEGEHSACPEGHDKVAHEDGLNGDFNQGAGGQYIYLCVKYGQESNPITDLQVSTIEQECQKGGWGEIGRISGSNGDFNHGAGGKYIWLCYKTGGSKPIGNLKMVKGDCPSGMFRISNVGQSNGDFNQGAGGEYIYLCASHADQPCTATNVKGQWEYKFTVAGVEQVTLQHGTQKTHGESKTSEWSKSVTESVESGMEFEGFSSSITLSKTWSQSMATTYNHEWSVSKTEGFSFTPLQDWQGKAVWQWTFAPHDSCNHDEDTLTRDYAITPNGASIPCCLPGQAADAPFYTTCLSSDVMVPKGKDHGCKVKSVLV